MRPISVDEVPSSGSERERTASSGDSKGAGGPARRKTTAERPADQADGLVPDVNVVNVLAGEVPQAELRPTSSIESPGTFRGTDHPAPITRDPITRDLGRLDEAEAALKEARDFFVRHEIGLDAARVLLDLAMVVDRRGDGAELKRLAAEMAPIFASRDVHPEALAALALFQKAATAEQVDRALLDRIATELQRTAIPVR